MLRFCALICCVSMLLARVVTVLIVIYFAMTLFSGEVGIVLRMLQVVLLLTLLVGHNVQAQNCQPEASPATTPDSQLWDNGDGTVTDSRTGLMWKQCAEGLTGSNCVLGSAEFLTFQQALLRAQNINNGGGFAGHRNWRLPNIKELTSLLELQCTAPAINQNRFPNTLASSSLALYMSSTSSTDGYYFRISFADSSPDSSSKVIPSLVRLVRSE